MWWASGSLLEELDKGGEDKAIKMAKDIKFKAIFEKNGIYKTVYYGTAFDNDFEYPTGWKLVAKDLQFAYRKDVNGKELYEGDIVRYTEDTFLDKQRFDRIGRIVLCDSPGFRIEDAEDGHRLTEFFFAEFKGHPIEIIGNIFENADLWNSICKVCGGNGWIPKPNPECHKRTGWPKKGQIMKCDNCGGKGITMIDKGDKT